MQTMAVAYWTFHYAKRIFETFFVHRHALLPSGLVHACILPSFVTLKPGMPVRTTDCGAEYLQHNRV